MMTDASFRRFGGLSALALGWAGLGYGALLVMGSGGPGLGYRILEIGEGRGYAQAANLLLALMGFLTTVAVAASYELVAGTGRAWARWAAGLGMVGGAMMAAHGYWDFLRLPVLLRQWAIEDPARQAAIATFSGVANPVDPRGLGSLLFVGLFALVAGQIVLAEKRLPAYVGVFGLVFGALAVLAFFGGLAGPPILRTALMGLALCLAGPIWWLAIGWDLWRSAPDVAV